MRQDPFSVLVADESEHCRRHVRDTLEPEGYDVESAASGREAVDVVRRKRIHVVVLDFALPDYSGPETYHAIKDTLGVFLPCIFTALRATTHSLQEALSEDAITILPKPVDTPRLVHAVGWSVDRFYSRRLR